MNCSHFAGILADLQEGTLSPDEQSAAEAHLGKCSACRRLLDMARGDVDILPEDRHDELARFILDRTSGSVCARVESSLWDFVGGELNMEDSQLIALHLDHCADCRSVAADFVVIQEELPAIAEIEPGESFTREVVSATRRCRPYRSVMRTGFPAWWSRMVQRPSFSFEAAYLGTLVLFWAFSNPLLPLRSITFNEISSAAIQPSAKYLVSIGADIKTPVSNQLHEFASAVAMRKLAVSESLNKLAKSCENKSVSMLDGSVQSIKKWHRNQAVALLTFWRRVSPWIPLAKL